MIIAFSINFGIVAQNIKQEEVNNKIDTSILITSYNIKSQLLKKGNIQTDFDIRFPRFYKFYNPKSDKTQKKLSVYVLNEAYFTGDITFGISDKYNFFISLPIVDIHHYNPIIFQSGVGIGDMQLGMLYKPKKYFKKRKLGAYLFEGRLTIPTGEYSNLTKSDYPTGNGAFGLMLAINSTKKIKKLYRFKNIDLIYSLYYDIRINAYGDHTGDETGAYFIFQKPINTEYGNFGLESGIYAYYNFPDKKNDQIIPNSGDYSFDIHIGAWYKYLDKYYIRFAIPYSIVQNNAFMTKYQVFLKLSYIFN